MGIFDLFSFKKVTEAVFTKENFVYILTLAKKEIIARKKEEIEGRIKKAQVDLVVQGAIDNLMMKYNVTNKLVLWLISQIKKAVPGITQVVYDLLKEKVEEL